MMRDAETVGNGARMVRVSGSPTRLAEVESMSYFVKIHEPKARASARGFATHKSARSFARRAIREGADFVSIAFRPADAEGDESDALRNVYRAEVDTVNHVRRHVRIPVDTWRDFAARLAASAKSGARK